MIPNILWQSWKTKDIPRSIKGLSDSWNKSNPQLERKFMDDAECSSFILEHLGPHQINLKRLCTVYKLFYTSWLNYDKTKLIHYEDLLKKHQNINGVPYSDNWDQSKINSYLNYEAPLLPKASIDIITETLGAEFFKRIKYPHK
jgi:hypothetical protein